MNDWREIQQYSSSTATTSAWYSPGFFQRHERFYILAAIPAPDSPVRVFSVNMACRVLEKIKLFIFYFLFLIFYFRNIVSTDNKVRENYNKFTPFREII